MTNAKKEVDPNKKSFDRYPHVIFRKIKKHIDNDTHEAVEMAQDFLIRMDSTHAQESALLNYIKDGCILVGHKNLDPTTHQHIIDMIDGLTQKNIDPRLLEDEPKSALREKVQNVKRAEA